MLRKLCFQQHWMRLQRETSNKSKDSTSSMAPLEAFIRGWKKSFIYGGTATREEFWWFYLIDLVSIWIFGMIAGAISAATESLGLTFLVLIYSIASIFPTLSVTVRRLRDSGKGWTWIFIGLIPFIGVIWMIILLCQPSVIA